METRLQARIEGHEGQIQQLQSDVLEIKATLKNMAEDQEEEREFRNYMMSWVKNQQGKNPEMADSSGSGLFPPPFTANFRSDQTGNPQYCAAKKIKLPEFGGYDPRGWITKAELYFEIHGTTPELRTRLAQLSMTGVAQHWFTVRFKTRMSSLSTIKQIDSIHDYIDDFEYLLSLIPRLPESQALGYFLAGLRPEIKQWVRLHRPQTRLDAMYLAKDVEEMLQPSEHSKLSARYRYQTPKSDQVHFGLPMGPVGQNANKAYSNSPNLDRRSNNRTESAFRPSSIASVISPLRTDSTPNSGNRNRGVRSLSRSEWEDRRRKGLCFKCGQQFGPSHKCPEANFRVLLLADDEETDKEGEQLRMDSPEEAINEGEFATGECSILEFMGADAISDPKLQTMKLEGLLHGIPIVILVDSGATHNFISRRLTEALDLLITTFSGIKIKLGDEHKVLVTRKCVNLPIVLDECEFTIDALLFEMGNLDMVLGIAWLKTLGEVIHNWELHTMRFKYHDREVCLTGTSFPGRVQSSLQSWLTVAESSLCLVEEGQIEGGSSTLSPCQSQELLSLFAKYAPVFDEMSGLPPVRSRDHAINLLPNQGPVCVRPYRYPHAHKAEIERQVHELLKLGVIRPSNSSYASPVILVRKKDQSWRMCVDYRALNKATIPDKHPIPVVDELIDELRGTKFFSKLDLKSGYNQIRMRPESIEKTAFRTHDGHYEYLVMPFGLTNAPATFQAIMNDIFRPYLRKFIVVFFDDILVYSPTWEQHLLDLSLTLATLVTHQFVVNRKKCSFGQMSVEYLGHIIDGEGVSMDPKKIQAVLEWPTPRQVKGVRGFLGLTGYYRKFVRNYGAIAKPLTDITKKNNFHWDEDTQQAFDRLKHAITSAPVLALPDFSAPFVVECDASGRGIGAVLMQQHRPIAFYSKALSDRNLAKSAYEREIMALALAVQHWRSYLLGTTFTVYSDQKSLKHLLHQRITTPDQQNWVAKLLGYHFDICYKAGRENRAADALSRRDDDGELCTSTVFQPIWVQGAQLVEEARSDPDLQKLIRQCQQQPGSLPGYEVRSGILYYKGRLVIPRNSKWIPELLAEFHKSATGGHSGYYRTYRRLAANIYWPGMSLTTQRFVQACDVCQRCKTSSLTPAGLLQPLDIPEAIWEHLSMDFILGLPKSKGFDALLVVVDRLSKYSHFILLKHPYTARNVADIFVKEVVRLHGIPKSIVSDRDPVFMSRFWQELFRLQGTRLHMSSSYHPQSDGQTEVINRCLETYLRCFAVDQPRSWSLWVPWAEFWYNSTFHESIGASPFEIVYGRKPPTVCQFIPGEVRVETVKLELKDRDEALKQLRVHLLRAQSRMKNQADKKRREVEFHIGDLVYVKLRPYRQLSLASRINQKLSARYFGPFEILDRIGSVAYRLKLPATSKGVMGEADLPAELDLEVADQMFPESIRAIRTIDRHGDAVEQWLIKWRARPLEEATWEDALVIQTQFPDVGLEDKTIFEGAPTVTEANSLDPAVVNKPIVWRVYSRRAKAH
ncbi:hypothetical protein OSB04_014376 [Centaurea solstitialis]|uniref:Reverse transcriptase n=1 Tax=Centaurea solstitialis TaxID=347529 RepID=A0AA38T874_9ASTR|nr:hypothetical protein OSB04_014376 [Centaurea solstitialis]